MDSPPLLKQKAALKTIALWVILYIRLERKSEMRARNHFKEDGMLETVIQARFIIDSLCSQLAWMTLDFMPFMKYRDIFQHGCPLN